MPFYFLLINDVQLLGRTCFHGLAYRHNNNGNNNDLRICRIKHLLEDLQLYDDVRNS